MERLLRIVNESEEIIANKDNIIATLQMSFEANEKMNRFDNTKELNQEVCKLKELIEIKDAEIEAIYEVPEEQTDDNLEIYNETETNSTREKRETSSELLSFDDVVLIFDMCRYEKAWNPTEISPWCAAFKEEDLKV